MKMLRIVALFLCLFTAPAFAQYIHKTEKCSDLSLDPTLPDGKRPFDQFYRNGSLPASEKNCWVHEDRSGKNRVITPYYWGETPDEFNTEYINAAFEGLSKSRFEFRKIGRTNLKYSMILSEVRPDVAEAFWPTSDTCYMEASYAFMQSDTIEKWKQVVAHEVGHCHIMENVPDYSHITYNENDKWWDESAAEWLGSLVFPEVNREVYSAEQFEMDAASFKQPYNAFLLFAHFANRNNNRMSWNLIKSIAGQRSPADLAQFFKLASFHSFFHDFLVTHFEQKIVNLGGDFYPKESEVKFHESSPLRFNHDETLLKLSQVREGRVNLYKVFVPKGYKVTLIPLSPASPVSVSVKKETDNWLLLNRPLEFSSDCESESSLDLFVDHLQVDPIAELSFDYVVEKKADCACRIQQTRVDQCLLGRWSIDVPTIEAMIRREAASHPVIINSIAGNETHHLRADRNGDTAFQWRIDGTSTHPSTQGIRVNYEWAGTTTFQFGTKGENQLCGQQMSKQFEGKMTYYFPDGSTRTLPMSRNSGPAAPLDDGEVVYTCSERRLEFSKVIEGETWTVVFNRTSHD